jgi:hypothetical protein
MKKTLLLTVLVVLLSAFAQPVKKYIVTVCIEKIVYAPCPQAGQKDTFGRVLPSNCTRVHFLQQHDTLRFEFEDSLQARSFYQQAFGQIGVVPADTTAGVINNTRFDIRVSNDTLK